MPLLLAALRPAGSNKNKKLITAISDLFVNHLFWSNVLEDL